MRNDLPRPDLVTVGDIFDSFDVTKLKGDGNIRKIYKCSSKNTLARKIFLRYLHTVFTAICEGGLVFEWGGTYPMQIGWERKSDRSFKNSLKYGNYKGLDILACNFINYNLVVRYIQKGSWLRIPVALSSNFKNRVIEKLNEGYKYC